MTYANGSYPGPQQSVGELRIIGQEWVDHGYKITPIFEEIEPCAICDAPDQNCTHFTVYDPYAQEGGSDVSRFTPSDLPEPAEQGYLPGQFAESDPYDIPQGSQSTQPERRPNATAKPNPFEVVTDPDDPDYGIITSGAVPDGDPATASAPSFTFNEDGDYVAIPVQD